MNIALLGLGTVGSGVVELLQLNKTHISQAIGEQLTITHVYVNNMNKERSVDLTGMTVTDNIETIYESDIDLVIEVMGGIEGTRDIIAKFLTKGIHVVTANKDMLAAHIDELSQIANQHSVTLAYEASTAGGIPVIRGIQTGLNSNRINQVLGILNGTSNYILTRMSQDGWDYQTALTKAQELGYAEADPTNDVEGYDAQRKILLLSRLAYNKSLNLEDVSVRGISRIEVQDLAQAAQAGYTMKLLGTSRLNEADNSVSINVEPVLLASSHQLAHVNDAMNSVFVKGNGVGEAMFYGPGAGGLATASAVVSDVMNIATQSQHFNFLPTEKARVVADTTAKAYYIRLQAAPTKADWVETELVNDSDRFVAVSQAITPTELAEISQDAAFVVAYPIEA